MSAFLGEFIGTAILMLMGNGVVANVALDKTKGFDAGLIVVAFGWAIGVFAAVYIVAPFSGAHINPAVTLGLAMTGDFPWADVPGYMVMQLLGAAVGTTLVYMMYKPHYDVTDDQGAILSTFATNAEIRSTFPNVLSELLGTFVLVYGVLHIVGATVGSQAASLGALDALPVALTVFGIGLCLGGTTVWAINPARDLAPRIMHAILPINGKGSSDWSYAWIPVIGPFLGAALAAVVKIYIG